MRTFLAIGLFFTLLFNVQAQETSFGIKGGFNSASLSDDEGFTTDARNGFHVGIYGEARLSDFIAIQPELLYSQQGSEIESEDTEYKQKVDYINLPVMLKLYLIPGVFAEVGPQIGLAINDETESNVRGLFSAEQETDPNSFDYGVNIGAGFKLLNGVQAGVRYNYGLGDLYDESDDFNNRVVQVYLGLEL